MVDSPVVRTVSSSVMSHRRLKSAVTSVCSRMAESSNPRQARMINAPDVNDAEWEKRRAGWKAPPLEATSGTLYKYTKLVASASQGCITDYVISTDAGIDCQCTALQFCSHPIETDFAFDLISRK